MNNNNINTRIYKDYYGKLKAETDIKLPALDRTKGDKLEQCSLELRTYKTDRGELVSVASIGWVYDNCRSFIVFQDYNKTWMATPCKRMTEKVLTVQHDNFVAMLEEIKQDVLNFYTKKVSKAL